MWPMPLQTRYSCIVYSSLNQDAQRVRTISSSVDQYCECECIYIYSCCADSLGSSLRKPFISEQSEVYCVTYCHYFSHFFPIFCAISRILLGIHCGVTLHHARTTSNGPVMQKVVYRKLNWDNQCVTARVMCGRVTTTTESRINAWVSE